MIFLYVLLAIIGFVFILIVTVILLDKIKVVHKTKPLQVPIQLFGPEVPWRIQKFNELNKTPTEIATIVYGIDPLKKERINPIIHKGKCQTELLTKKLIVPSKHHNFFIIEEVGKYQIGLRVNDFLFYLEKVIAHGRLPIHKASAMLYKKCIQKGMKKVNEKFLSQSEKELFNANYRIENGLTLKDNVSSFKPVCYSKLMKFLDAGFLVVKNIETNTFEPTIFYCETHQYFGPMAGGVHFNMLINKDIIFECGTVIY